MLSELAPFVNEGARLREEEQTVPRTLCGFGVEHALHISIDSNGGGGWGQGLKEFFRGGHCFAPPPETRHNSLT